MALNILGENYFFQPEYRKKKILEESETFDKIPARSGQNPAGFWPECDSRVTTERSFSIFSMYHIFPNYFGTQHRKRAYTQEKGVSPKKKLKILKKKKNCQVPC